MGYIALYRKYRPITFESVVGQENVTAILKNQIIKNKISHAYIFSGTRGTGKTSSAKIFARAINCENPINGEPCNECKSCKSILSGENTDVVEMDAASNNSVENVRQIRTEVMYASTNSKYKVYIIDEVHMLTTSAFNALLKTLEEPPTNVVFILATTEQHKIPVTILSRCLRFEFLRISTENIKKRLRYVLEEENIKYEEEAIEYVAKLADGALRDGLSILDRCLSEDSEKLELSKVKDIIGGIDNEIIEELSNSIINHKYEDILELITELENKGKDLRQVVYELTQNFLDRMIKEENKEKIADIIDTLSSLDADIRMSINPSILVKSTLIKIAQSKKVGMDSNNMELNDKLIRLEDDVSKIKNYLTNNKNKIIGNNNIQSKNAQNIKQGFTNAEEFKKKLSAMGKIKLFSTLSGAIMKDTENEFVIITTNEFAAKMLVNEKNEIASLLKQEYGIDKPIVIKYNKVESPSKMEKLLKDSNTDYTEM